MERKLQDRKNLTLSWADRVILIRACHPSIPLYCMSCFKLPKTLCKNMTVQMIGFWLNGGEKRKECALDQEGDYVERKGPRGLGLKMF